MRPIGFQIWDFKSIKDSGYCSLSEDGITAIAGQNESGKTSLLTALRDFDLDEDEPPETPDYFPDEDSENRNPRAGVKFSVTKTELAEVLGDDHAIPERATKKILEQGWIWIFRYFVTGKFVLSQEMADAFEKKDEQTQGESKGARKVASSEGTELAPTVDLTLVNATTGEPKASEPPATETTEDTGSPKKMLSTKEFASLLRLHTPYFIYFDTFKDELPREISIQPVVAATTAVSRKAAYDELPATVKDFLTLAKVDVEYLSKVATDDRLLGNYLHGKAANITGHFLTYWRQRTDSEETVTLRTQHTRKASGELFLAFYVNDGKDQYPDQRSRGFLWFLSFFLRLTSANLTGGPSLILIDEPGTFLHSKAQKDVLALLEDWIVKTHTVLYSTHSPYLLPADKLHRVRLVGKQKKKGTFVADRLTDGRLKGSSFTDALSPVLTSIGLDLNESFNLVQKRNIIVEGISDYYYLHAWNKLLKLKALEDVSIFPGTSASTVPTLASLLIGWGTNFCALLDRDGPGNAAVKKLRDDMGVEQDVIIQFTGALTIEDLFEPADFKLLLESFDKELTVDAGTVPNKTMTKHGIDKVLLARHFSTQANIEKSLIPPYSAATTDRVKALFGSLTAALDKQPIKPRPTKT